ncbi:hypothetical protein HPT25_27810 [Bacillus sp. BRMEA1]|uniref:hypothetical protein n=1 Tax=Neobacillus endophyticus TaxID=2738405 RepID=UPI001566275A|nr:hypothetical protein [Neobacillus endophyticus]NRD81101.1 hypothetical protein [Neobacillus endophyticus]
MIAYSTIGARIEQRWTVSAVHFFVVNQLNGRVNEEGIINFYIESSMKMLK